MLRPVVLAFAILATCFNMATAHAEVVKQAMIGCKSKGLYDRFIRIAHSGDFKTANQLLEDDRASGECMRWELGAEVRVEEVGSSGLICLARFGSVEQCWWTSRKTVE